MEEFDTAHPNVRHHRYFIVEGRTTCAQCSRITAVVALALPAGYESLIVSDDTPDDQEGSWESIGSAAVLSYVEYLPQAVVNRVHTVTSRYLLMTHQGRGGGFWINCCEHCGGMMDEEDLHGDLDSPFGPMPAQGLECVQLHLIREPLEARVGRESHDVKPLDS